MQANDNITKLRHSDVSSEIKAEDNITKTNCNVKNDVDDDSINNVSPAVKIRRTLVMDNNSKILRSNNENENGLKKNTIDNCLKNSDVSKPGDVLELFYNKNLNDDKINIKKDQNIEKKEEELIEENLLNYFYKLLRKKNQFTKEEEKDFHKGKQLSQQQKSLQEEEDDKNFNAEMDACFTAFDKDGDDRLSICEFALICRALFRNDRGHIYEVSKEWLDQMFAVFDQNGDGHIDREEFQFCWNNWIKAIVRPVNAFLVVDVQNDFISGSLDISNCSAQQNGVEIVEPINNLLDSVDFDAVFYSLDWHPSDHVSFIDNVKKRPLDETSPIDADSAQVYDTVIFAGPPPMKQRLWPRHCVQDSWGAELHKDLKVVEDGIKVYKGTNPEVDSYSVFWDNKKLSETTLNDQLKMKGTTDIYVCGLAYDVCVGATAVDALSAGYRTILIDDCCRGVDLNDIENTKEKVNSSHGVIAHSNEVKAMVEGRDRRPELGYKLAMELKNPESVLATRNNGVRRSI